jgi:Tol biopolymer transport system component
MSADGRFVGFTSPASNLAADDTNGTLDVFIHDRNMGITELVSVDSDGTQGPDRSYDPSVSANGRYVAFSSHCSNLVPEDTNGVRDIFVRDRIAGITERVSVASDGTQANMDSVYKNISADGRYVAFASYANNLVPGDTNGHYDIFVHDRESGQTERISVASDGTQANNWSAKPVISADGRFVAFQSKASNLVSGDTNGGYDQEGFDMFVHDRSTRETIRVSVASDGSEADQYSHWGTISADGLDVAFTSYARNLVPGDTNAKLDAFVHTRFEVMIFLPVVTR